MGKKKERIRELEHAIKAVSEAYAHTIDTVDALKKERDGLREQLKNVPDPTALKAAKDEAYRKGLQDGKWEHVSWLGEVLKKNPAVVWHLDELRAEAESIINTARCLHKETK